MYRHFDNRKIVRLNHVIYIVRVAVKSFTAIFLEAFFLKYMLCFCSAVGHAIYICKYFPYHICEKITRQTKILSVE